MGYYFTDDYLAHHGIKGQRWGIRRFQKQDGTRTAAGKARAKENSSSEAQNESKRGLSDSQKKALKIGASLVAAGLVAYGGYKLATSPKAKAVADNVLHGNKEKRLADINKELESLGPEIVRKDGTGGSSGIIKNVGKSFSNVDKEVVTSINKNGWTGDPPRLKQDYARNCSQTSIAYIMNSVLGKDVTAKGFGGVDELSGMVQNNGRHKNVFTSVFDGVKTTEVPTNNRNIHSAINLIENGTTGIIRLENKEGMGHFLNYEKDKSGRTTFVDCQTGKLFDVTSKMFSPEISLTDIFDCSNVSLREGAEQYLKYMVE